MIFVIVGSQKFQFNRLLQKLDELIAAGVITDDVFAQTGESDYTPKHFDAVSFLDRTAFAEKVATCDLVITHGGTGAIIGALKQGKPVVAVPRRAQYAEHVDDHQYEIIGQFEAMKMICPCYELDELEMALTAAASLTIQPYESNTGRIIDSIQSFVETLR